MTSKLMQKKKPHTQKTLDKIKHPFLIKTHSKIGIGGNFLNLIKGIWETTRVYIILNSERLNIFLIRAGPRQGCSPHHFCSILY